MNLMHTLALGVTAAVVLSACTDNAAPPAPLPEASSTGDTPATVVDTASGASTTLASETRTFRDWTAVCDNVNNCAAYGPAADDMGFVMVRLEPGPTATPHVIAASWQLPEDTRAITLTIDKRDYRGRTTGGDNGNPLLMIENASPELLRALGNGSALTLSAGEQKTTASLSGAAAAFLWIDERQGRLGTSTALIRRGDRPASAVPAAPPPPRLNVAAPVAQNDLPKAMAHQVAGLQHVRDCAADNQNSLSASERWHVHRLGADTLLWEIPCGTGAYNFSQLYVLSANDGSNARTVNFPTTAEPERALINSRFDASSNTLSSFAKGRGIGDCGALGVWVWTGHQFALLEEDVMGDCLGARPDYWPSTWRAAR